MKKTSDVAEKSVYLFSSILVAEAFMTMDYAAVGAEFGCMPSDTEVCWTSTLSKLALTSLSMPSMFRHPHTPGVIEGGVYEDVVCYWRW